MILFKSYNMEEMFNLLVVDDPNSASYDAHKEVCDTEYLNARLTMI